ncbi:MAG: translation initiation factor IF-6 [Candidatus Micrarchaeota archaeon]|nr:translation initiation factor IF-6 [Candidatus Micrarchaeota archaeon]
MDAAKCRISGSDYAGVFCSASDRLILVPLSLSRKEREVLSSTLHAEIVDASVGESNLVGLFSKVNSSGIILSNLTTDSEVRTIRDRSGGRNVEVLHSSINAIGSNILANDRIAIVNEEYSDVALKQISDVLGVETVRAEAGGFKTVGANNILTNSGLVINNRATDLDQSAWEEMTGFKTIRTTANTGALAIGLAAVANSNGVVAGEETTGFELNRILQGLEPQ